MKKKETIIDITKKWKGSVYEPNINDTEVEQIDYCIHFIQEIMMKLDKTISNIMLKQKKGGEEVKKNDLILEDCIYFDNNEGIKYIGLYIRNNKMIYPFSKNGKRIIIEENITKLNTKNIHIRRFLPKYEIGDFLLHTRTPFKYCEKISKFVLGDHK